MALTAAELARLRRMVAEPTDANGYTDSVLTAAAERCPLPDADGYDPDHADWVATYDLAGAAADVWTEKAAGLAGSFDFSADGGSFTRSQAYGQAQQQATYWRSRRAAVARRLKAQINAENVGDYGN